MLRLLEKRLTENARLAMDRRIGVRVAVVLAIENSPDAGGRTRIFGIYSTAASNEGTL